MMNLVYTLCSSTPGQIQYGGFKRALAKKSGDMIRDRVRILYLLFLCFAPARKPCMQAILYNSCKTYGQYLKICQSCSIIIVKCQTCKELEHRPSGSSGKVT